MESPRGISSKEKPKKRFLKKGEGKSCLSLPTKKKEQKSEEPVFQPAAKVNVCKVPEFQVIEPKIKEPRKKIPILNQTPAPTKPQTDETIYYDPSALKCDDEILPPQVKEEPKKANKVEDIYNEKMNELSLQIERFNKQSNMLKSENKDMKSKIQMIERDYEDFMSKRTKRVQDLQVYKENEIKRISKEMLALKKKYTVEQPTKTDEIEELMQLLRKTQEEIAIKEAKNGLALNEITKNYANLIEEINELETQVKIREQIMLKEKFNKSQPKVPTEKVFNDGTKRKVFPDGREVICYFNGDIKEIFPDGRVIYMYNDDQTTQTTFPDGTEVFEFSSGQIEKTYPDGRKEITFPDGTSEIIYND